MAEDLVTRYGAQARFVATDVAAVAEAEKAVAAADEFGGVTVLVDDAGVVRPPTLLEVTEEDYDTVMDTQRQGHLLHRAGRRAADDR